MACGCGRSAPGKEAGTPSHKLPKEASGDPRPDPESTQDLLRRARGGDSEALDRLCARYLPRLRRWAGGRIPPGARGLLDTEDIVQETIARTFPKLGAFEPRHDGALQAYLRQVLSNRIRDEVRRLHRIPPPEAISEDRVDPGRSPLEEAIGRENLERYEAALQRLDDPDREAIVLRLELGYDYVELAEALGKPTPDAARMAVSRAVGRLAQEIARER